MQFTRDTWWDALLLLYSGRTHGLSPEGTVVLTRDQRESTTQQVILDLRQLFRASNYWFSFLNVSRFFVRLHDPRQRQMIQPSLVLAALAVSVFIHSSEREGGSKGRAWAMRLRDEAQGALEASLSTRSVDLSLVHAAWVITDSLERCLTVISPIIRSSSRSLRFVLTQIMLPAVSTRPLGCWIP